jgi:hypothetical protein|tara:strand:- start:820 stop:1077 length:258 start_codon:yes stop_codon:yes gene_type:complete
METNVENEYDGKLSDLRPLYEWHQEHLNRGGVLFPTFGSLKWFIRQHRDELVNAGVLLIGVGGRVSLVTPKFGEVVYRNFFKVIE